MISFLGGDPGKSGPLRPPADKDQTRKRKLPLSEEVQAQLAKFFAEELKTCAAELGGAAVTWPGRYF